MKTDARETGIDLERFRLRRFVDELVQKGELEWSIAHDRGVEAAELGAQVRRVVDRLAPRVPPTVPGHSAS